MSEASTPQARRGGDADVIFGHTIADPYRWLEDTGSAETRAWLEAQAKLKAQMFAGGELATLRRMAEQAPLPLTASAVAAAGGRLFFVQPHPHGSYPTLSCLEHGKIRVLVDPAELGPDWTIARHGVYPSPGGRFVAYGVQKVGDDLATMRIRDIARNVDIDEIAPSVLPVIAWRDETTLYYNALRGIYRQAGQQPEETGLIRKTIGGGEECALACPWDGGWTVQPFASADGRYLFINRVQLLRNRAQLLVRPLGDETAPFVELLAEGEGAATVIGARNDDVFVATTIRDERGRIIALTLRNGVVAETREVVKAGRDILAPTPYPTARMHTIWRDRLYVTRLSDGRATIAAHALDGGAADDIATPGFCSVNGLLASGDRLLVQLESFTVPETLYALDASKKLSPLLTPTADGPQLAWQTLWAESADGTRVPCTVAAPADEAGSRPTLLLAYGGLGAPTTPRFREEIWLALQRGFACALAHVRGGGEYGRAWHRAAMGAAKQRSFDDCYAVAKKIVEAGIATRDTLMLKGESYGGLLAAVAYAQRPDLFAAVVAEVPLVDVVRHLGLPGGGIVAADLGDPLKDETIFNSVLAFAPMQHLELRDRKPALLVTPAALDNRAPPGLAFKFVAAAQHNARADQPVVLNLIEGCGHAGWPLAVRRDAAAHTIAFLALAARR